MPIKLPRGLPASRTLAGEGIEVLDDHGLRRRGLRPLRIALVNLMPQKATTETQIARLLGGGPFEVDLTLCIPDSCTPRSTSAEHIAAFYERWSAVRHRRFDGLIVTGAPVETRPFEDVAYWRELTGIFDWTRGQVGSTLHICWAAQAALYYFHGVPKHVLAAKRFGVFTQRVASPGTPLVRGFDELFPAPVSRHSEVLAEELPPALEVLADSPDSGLCLVADAANRAVFMFNHLEYDTDTLKEEYLRDLASGQAVPMPSNYFPEDDPDRAPRNGWRAHGHLLFGNWLAEVARAARHDETSDLTVEWLLTEHRMPEGVLACDFLVVGADCAETVPGMMRRLADLGLSPEALRVHRRGDGTALVELRLGRMLQATVETVSRELFKVPGTRRVTYRGADGSGGTLLGAPRASAA